MGNRQLPLACHWSSMGNRQLPLPLPLAFHLSSRGNQRPRLPPHHASRLFSTGSLLPRRRRAFQLRRLGGTGLASCSDSSSKAFLAEPRAELDLETH